MTKVYVVSQYDSEINYTLTYSTGFHVTTTSTSVSDTLVLVTLTLSTGGGTINELKWFTWYSKIYLYY